MPKQSEPTPKLPDHDTEPALQDDDTAREDQLSHRDNQNRTKKDGHTTQIGSSQDQVSQRNRGPGAPSR